VGFLDINIVAVILFTLSIIALKIFKPNPILIIVGSGIVGMAVYLLINEY
jgi:chromate transporter